MYKFYLKIGLFITIVGLQSAIGQKLNYFPEIPNQETNPHFKPAFKNLKVKLTDTIPLKSVGFTQSDETFLVFYSYFHPQSPQKGNPAYLKRLLLLLDNIFYLWNSNPKDLNEMTYYVPATFIYNYLKKEAPQLIPVGKTELWDAAVKKNIEATIQGSPAIYKDKSIGALWLNGDIRRIMGVYFGSLAIGDVDNAALAKNLVEDYATKSILTDGGTHYAGYHNESPAYRGELEYFVWYYLWHKGTPAAAKMEEFFSKWIPYCPLMFHPLGKGFFEYTSSPTWKSYYWCTLRFPSLFTAYVTGDVYNHEIGKDYYTSEGPAKMFDPLMLSMIYKPNINTKPLPDNWVLFDRNQWGPRGRFGTWGFVGNLRNTDVPTPELDEKPNPLGHGGINSFVGGYILDPKKNGAKDYPLDAAFHATFPIVKFKQGVEKDWSRGNVWAIMTGKETKSSVTKSKSYYGISAKHAIAGRNFTPSKWEGMQQWVLSKDRIIGMTTINSLEETKIYGLAQKISFVNKRKNKNNYLKLKKIDESTFEYGMLKTKIHEKDYEGSVDSLYYGIYNEEGDKGSVMLQIHDKDSGKDQLNVYPQGYQKYVSS